MQAVLTTDDYNIFDTDIDNSLPLVLQKEQIHTNASITLSGPATHAGGCLGNLSQVGPQPTVVRKGVEVLDSAYAAMFECRMAEGVRTLIDGLADLRRESAEVPDDWRYFANDICPAHPIADLIRQDPMKMAAAAQGTAGTMRQLDCQREGMNALLDYIYENREMQGTTITGQCIAKHTAEIDLVRSLRSRRSILAQRIDEAGANGHAHILVIGAGRFHEGDLSTVASSGKFEQFVVVDEDSSALKDIDARFGKNGVETVQASVRSLLSRFVEFSGFDIVYAPTLFDKLNDQEARRLAETMFSMLAPGGRILLVNAGDQLSDTAYREAFLGWTVIGRSESELVALTNGIPNRFVGQVRLYRDEYGLSNFVELYRR